MWPELLRLPEAMPGQRQPIHDAAERGDLAAVRAELAKGVSTEVQDEGYCQTPLHRAAIKGEVEVVLELIKANANLEAKRSVRAACARASRDAAPR